MAGFSITEAGLKGVRLAREHPDVVAVWAGLYALMGLATAMVSIATIGPQAPAMHTPGGATASQTVAPFALVMAPLVVVFWAVVTCAVYRTILEPAASGIGRVRLGAAELRMMGLIVVLFVLLVVSLWAYHEADQFGAITAATGGATGAFAGNLLRLAALAAMTVFWVRMSLAGPDTYASERIRVFHTWVLTRGHFWRLVAAYGLATGLALVVSLIALVVFLVAGLVFAFGSHADLNHLERVFQPDIRSIPAFFTPAQIFNQVFSALFLVAEFVVLLSPAAVIRRDLTTPSG
jgi:hypothetical protein